MPNETPNVGAPEWEAQQAQPWTPHNEALRIFDAFSVNSIVEDRDLTAPPSTCSDGARYLIASGATGLWFGYDGQLAIALGANASNGWHFATVETEGTALWVRDEAEAIRYRSGVWQVTGESITSIDDLSDVSTNGLVDGAVLMWDASGGMFYPAEIETLTPQVFMVAASDETTDLTVGDNKLAFPWPENWTLTKIRASVSTQCVGGPITVDVVKNGTTILTSTIDIPDGAYAAETDQISDPNLGDLDTIRIDVDAIGATTAGNGLKITFYGYRNG